MAFDHQIEADRIDDFNLFSAFVRVPLLILGGVLGGKDGSHPDDDDIDPAVRVHRLDDDAMDCSSDADQHASNHCRQVQQQDMLNNNAPSCRIVSDNSMEVGSGLKRTKKMSWSDESGLSLVQYNDETLPHEPVPSKPIKSVLKRSFGPMQQVERDGAPSDGTRYLPRMVGNGMNMPLRPYGGAHYTIDPTNSNGSEMSPQWGWYINTTPPTPEMYYSTSSFASKVTKADTSGGSSSQGQSSTASTDTKKCHNHVFQNLQSSNTPMGWTSVPI